jgi:hypothetical protein
LKALGRQPAGAAGHQRTPALPVQGLAIGIDHRDLPAMLLNGSFQCCAQ